MSELSLQDPNFTSVVLDYGTYPIPPGTQHPEFVVPTEVTDFIIQRYGLTDRGRRVLDPYLGNATFIGRLREKGGDPDGIELNPDQFEFAVQNLIAGEGLLFNGEIKLGDCTKTATELMNLGYHTILTAPPFLKIDELNRPEPFERDPRTARALSMMLHSAGVLIIDSANSAERDGRTLTPAKDTIEYLTGVSLPYSYGFFNLIARHEFEILNPPEGCDGQFTELVFVKRWPRGAIDSTSAMAAYLLSRGSRVFMPSDFVNAPYTAPDGIQYY